MSEVPHDLELIEAVTRQDVAALRTLFDRHAPVMLAIAGRVLGDVHEAEDLVNEVFVELWQKADQFSPDRGALRTYLYLLTRSRSIDRRRARGTSAGDVVVEAHDRSRADHTPGPDQQAAQAEERAMIRGLLDVLPEEQREAVSRAFFDGQTHREIAESTDQPLGTIKGRIRQGLIRLRDEMRKRRKGDGP